uniref:BTB domain-containing protein n=1 Tax=Panagrolaimus davidi TaxID=227884 RepID=A0A914P4I6_9BILA
MLQQINFVRTVQLPVNSGMTIKLSDNLEFTLYRCCWTHKIKNVKGDFEITKITEFYGDGQPKELKYIKSSTRFEASDVDGKTNLTFYITAMVEMTEIREMYAVKYELQIPSALLQRLKIRQFYKSQFVLPGYDGYKFTYFVNKIINSTENDIEIQIKNPYDVEIEGKKGDYSFVCGSTKNIDLPLLFTFYADEIPVIEESENPNSNELHGSPQESSIDESRPESVIPSHSSKTTTLLQKIATNNQFADVYFVSSDGEKIPSHRCILAEFSNIFLKIFEESTEVPVQITADDFDAETIQSALNFLCDKSDSINGKETEIFKFAIKFGIKILITTCLSFFEESVDSTNVYEFIQIAYSNNFDELKQKCLQILVQKKEEIDPTKMAKPPSNIVVDAFFFKM